MRSSQVPVAVVLVLMAAPFAHAMLGPDGPALSGAGEAPRDRAWMDALTPWLGAAPGTLPTAPPLEDALVAAAAALGLPAPAAADLATVAALPPDVREAAAALLARAAGAGQARAALAAAGVAPEEPAFGAVMRGQAARIVATVADVLPVLELASARAREGLAPPAFVEVPLLLLYDSTGPTLHTRDHVLTLDLVGADTYDNHIGGTLLAVGPIGEPGTVDPLVATDQLPQPLLGGGGMYEAATAVVSAGIALDLDGDDTYGVYRAPWFDASCTSEPVVRQVGMQGAGVEGVGLLLDARGNDAYRAKTFAQGAGHPGGVGLLLELEGDDTYTAIRNAQGSALIGGTGILLDEAGSDAYHQVMPAGGVVNDQLFCDDVPRHVQGAGFLDGAGVLLERGGDDTYRALLTPGGAGFAQGYAFQGVGLLWDQGGADDYGGFRGHTDGMRAVTAAVGLFMDEA